MCNVVIHIVAGWFGSWLMTLLEQSPNDARFWFWVLNQHMDTYWSSTAKFMIGYKVWHSNIISHFIFPKRYGFIHLTVLNLTSQPNRSVPCEWRQHMDNALPSCFKGMLFWLGGLLGRGALPLTSGRTHLLWPTVRRWWDLQKRMQLTSCLWQHTVVL